MDKVKTLLFIILALLIAFFVGMLLAPDSHASEVTLSWDANSEADLAGYKVYFAAHSGSPYDGTGSPVIVPIASLPTPSTPAYTVTDLDPAKVWYFVVTAYDTEGLESDYSNEVSTGTNYYEDGKPPKTPTGLKAWWQRLISWLFGDNLKIKSVG